MPLCLTVAQQSDGRPLRHRNDNNEVNRRETVFINFILYTKLNTTFQHHLMGDAGLTDPVGAVVHEDCKPADHVPDRLKAIEDVLFSNVNDIYTNGVHTTSTGATGEKNAVFRRVNDEDVFPFTGHNDGEKQRAMQIMYETLTSRLET